MVAQDAISGAAGAGVALSNNIFYTETNPEIDDSNSIAPYDSALAAEQQNWPDPDRTLKRYVTEELNLTLLAWSDSDIPEDQITPREVAGEVYDPTGVKTFMAVATNMRAGGVDAVPTSGKPNRTGDYPWDERFTGQAVVNWMRAGFNLNPVGASTVKDIE
jgi:hypothetical protein